MTTITAAPTAAKPPLRFFVTLLELAALGALGGVIGGILGGLVGLGFGMLFLLGLGIFVLIGAVYVLFGVAWFENVRVRELYRLPGAPLRWRPQERPGFVGWLLSIWRQLGEGRLWLALVSFAASSLLGAIMLFALQGLVYATVWFRALPAPIFGGGDGTIFGIPVSTVALEVAARVGLAVVAGGAIIAIVFVHRAITVALFSAGREAALEEQVATTSAQRAGAVRAADVERTRIERDLHDGVQPRLVSIGMSLGLAQQKIDSDPAAAKLLVAEAHTSTKAAITELRQLARGIHASVLDDRGLDAALSALAGRSHVPVALDVRMNGRCSRESEAAVYFAVAESLTNAAKHSRASECRVSVRRRDEGTLWARVEDNGMGGAHVQPGGGLDGILNRITAAGGTVRLESPAGGPTSLEVSVPCAF